MSKCNYPLPCSNLNEYFIKSQIYNVSFLYPYSDKFAKLSKILELYSLGAWGGPFKE